MNKNKVSVIIVTCNSLSTIPDCLKALELCAESSDIIIIDNKSTDGTIQFIEENHPDIYLIKTKKNIGFGPACNVGASFAKGEFLFFLNPDVILEDDAILELSEAFQRCENPGALAARMVNPDGSFHPTCRELPTINNIFFSRGSLVGKMFSNSLYTHKDYNELTEVPAVSGTALFIKRVLFHELGGFDKRYFMYMEDTDLCLSLHRNGYKNYFVPDAMGCHHWGKGSEVGFFKRKLYHHSSVWKYFLKHYPNGFSLLLLPLLLVVNLTLIGLYSLVRKN